MILRGLKLLLESFTKMQKKTFDKQEPEIKRVYLLAHRLLKPSAYRRESYTWSSGYWNKETSYQRGKKTIKGLIKKIEQELQPQTETDSN